MAAVALAVKIVSSGVDPSQSAIRARAPSYRSVASTASGYTPRWIDALDSV